MQAEREKARAELREQEHRQLERGFTPVEIICVDQSDKACLELNMVKKLSFFFNDLY